MPDIDFAHLNRQATRNFGHLVTSGAGQGQGQGRFAHLNTPAGQAGLKKWQAENRAAEIAEAGAKRRGEAHAPFVTATAREVAEIQKKIRGAA